MCVCVSDDRLFNYGIGIHLLESSTIPPNKGKKINPKDNHISFQSSDMKLVVQKLEEMKIEYVTAVVEEGGVQVDQLFFHDPDGYMIEICNCDNLPVIPLTNSALLTHKFWTTDLGFRYNSSILFSTLLKSDIESQKISLQLILSNDSPKNDTKISRNGRILKP